jgi:hypothetical protein
MNAQLINNIKSIEIMSRMVCDIKQDTIEALEIAKREAAEKEAADREKDQLILNLRKQVSDSNKKEADRKEAEQAQAARHAARRANLVRLEQQKEAEKKRKAKAYRELHKEARKEKANEIVQCDLCYACVKRRVMSVHKKTTQCYLNRRCC